MLCVDIWAPWDITVLLATIFVAIAVPLNAAFHEPGMNGRTD